MSTLDELSIANIISIISPANINDHVNIISAVGNRYPSIIDDVYAKGNDYNDVRRVISRGYIMNHTIPIIIASLKKMDESPIHAVILMAILILSSYITLTMVVLVPTALPYSILVAFICWMGLITIHTNLPNILDEYMTNEESAMIHYLCRIQVHMV